MMIISKVLALHITGRRRNNEFVWKTNCCNRVIFAFCGHDDYIVFQIKWISIYHRNAVQLRNAVVPRCQR